MNVMSVSQARGELAEVIDRLGAGPVEIQRHGKPVAVMLAPEHHARLEEAYEELDDIRAYDDAQTETAPLIPWDEVKRELGLE